MKNFKSLIAAFLLTLVCTAMVQAQVTASGTVTEASNGEPIIGA